MSYFKKFPTINYSLDGYNKDAMNIITAALLTRVAVDRTYIYQSYDVPAGMTPEALANELYRDPKLCWVFFIVNRMVNPINDWPMDSSVLEQTVEMAYGNVNTIIHFTGEDGFILDDVRDKEIRALIADNQPIPLNVHPVTALEYETNKNRARGKIIIVAPSHINKFVDTYNKAIEGKL